MVDYLQRRNTDAHNTLIDLALRAEGVTRQEALGAKLGISISGVDAMLRRLTEQGLLSYKEESRDRQTGAGYGSSRRGGKVRSRSVRVYRATDKAVAHRQSGS